MLGLFKDKKLNDDTDSFSDVHDDFDGRPTPAQVTQYQKEHDRMSACGCNRKNRDDLRRCYSFVLFETTRGDAVKVLSKKNQWTDSFRKFLVFSSYILSMISTFVLMNTPSILLTSSCI